jgi:hypothetical protein
MLEPTGTRTSRRTARLRVAVSTDLAVAMRRMVPSGVLRRFSEPHARVLEAMLRLEAHGLCQKEK